MKNAEELIKKTDIKKISEEGSKIYEKIKSKYEPQDNGKFMAIDVDSGQVYIGINSSKAVQLARESYPDKVFYVVKIGYSATEILASIIDR